MTPDVRVAACDQLTLRKAILDLCGDATEGRAESFSCNVLRGAASGDVLLATVNGSLAGAVVARPAAGRVGWMWPPKLSNAQHASPTEAEISRQLIRGGLAKLTEAGIQLVQTLVPSNGPDGLTLEANGFVRLTEMIRMARNCDLPPASVNESPQLEFVPYDKNSQSEFAKVIERTYECSQDCPELDGLRSVTEVIEGYQAGGIFRPDLWLLACESNSRVGCVLLVYFAEQSSGELLYMGVVPEARGRRIGRSLCRRALLDAARIGACKLWLSVDARNQPALRLYETLGFVETERRSAYIFKLRDESERNLCTI